MGAMLSCTSESMIDLPKEMATLQINTKADGDPVNSDPDNRVQSLRVLIFKPDGTLGYNFLKEADVNSDPLTIKITEGEYDFAFIVNETSDTERRGTQTLTDILNSYQVNSTPVSELDNLYFSSSAFEREKDAEELPIPMTKRYSNVLVTADGNATGGGIGNEIKNGKWAVSVVRAGIRVDLTMAIPEEAKGKDFKLNVLNVPSKVYLFDDRYNVTESDSYEPVPRTFSPSDGEWLDDNTWKMDRLILPSSMFEDSTNEDLGTVLQINIDNSNYNLTLNHKDINDDESKEDDFCLRRNHKFEVKATLSYWDGIINVTSNVMLWEPAPQNVLIDGNYFLDLSMSKIHIGKEGATFSMTAKTNYKSPNTEIGHNDGLSLDFPYPDSWYSVRLDEPEVPGDILTYNIEVSINPLASGNKWTAFNIKAGNLNYEMEIYQDASFEWMAAKVNENNTLRRGANSLEVTTQHQTYVENNWLIWKIAKVEDLQDILIGTDAFEDNFYEGMTGFKNNEINFYIRSDAPAGSEVVITFENSNYIHPTKYITLKIPD